MKIKEIRKIRNAIIEKLDLECIFFVQKLMEVRLLEVIQALPNEKYGNDLGNERELMLDDILPLYIKDCSTLTKENIARNIAIELFEALDIESFFLLQKFLRKEIISLSKENGNHILAIGEEVYIGDENELVKYRILQNFERDNQNRLLSLPRSEREKYVKSTIENLSKIDCLQLITTILRKKFEINNQLYDWLKEEEEFNEKLAINGDFLKNINSLFSYPNLKIALAIELLTMDEKEKIENEEAKSHHDAHRYFVEEYELSTEKSNFCPRCEEAPCMCSDPF